MTPPHDHQHVVGHYHLSQESCKKCHQSRFRGQKKWSQIPWEQRAAILRAAELVAGPYRAKLNAATMIAQSKTIHQAEIDAAYEYIDFLRFNVEFMSQIMTSNLTPQKESGIV